MHSLRRSLFDLPEDKQSIRVHILSSWLLPLQLAVLDDLSPRILRQPKHLDLH